MTMMLIEKAQKAFAKRVGNEDGVIGYGIAWLLGVPVTLLVLIYLIRGH
jgi:hypothetical protein